MPDKFTIKMEGHKQVLASMAAGLMTMTDSAGPGFDRAILYMDTRTALTFNELAFGGSFRGVTWDYFAPESFGQKRPSKEIIEEGSTIMWDTGNLAKEAASVINRSRSQVVLGPVGVSKKYGPFQHALRPYLFIEEGKDDEQIAKIFAGEFETSWESGASFFI